MEWIHTIQIIDLDEGGPKSNQLFVKYSNTPVTSSATVERFFPRAKTSSEPRIFFVDDDSVGNNREAYSSKEGLGMPEVVF